MKDWLQEKHRDTLWTVKCWPNARWWKEKLLYQYLLKKSTPPSFLSAVVLHQGPGSCLGWICSRRSFWEQGGAVEITELPAADATPRAGSPMASLEARACCLPPAAANPELKETLSGPSSHPRGRSDGKLGGLRAWWGHSFGLSSQRPGWGEGWGAGGGLASSSSSAQRGPC